MTVDVSVPRIGPYRTPDHKYYLDGQGPFPSVTTVLNVIDKPALVAWAKRETAECAVRNWELLDGMRTVGGDRMMVEWLKGIPDYQRDTAANRGSRVHAAADALVRGVPIDLPPEEMPFLDAYRRFLADYDVRIVAAELMVFGGFLAGRPYGGTLDLIADLTNPLEPEPLEPAQERWLIDLKTSSGTYRETALQLAPYGMAEFGVVPGRGDRYTIPAVDRYGVLHIRPELYPDEGGYRLIPYDVNADTLAAFYAAYDLRRWLSGPNPKGDKHHGS